MPRRRRAKSKASAGLENLAAIATIVAAIIAASGAVSVGVITAHATVSAAQITASKEQAPPMSAPCIDLLSNYQAKLIAGGEPERELLLPGADGKAYVLEDPQAIACRITPTVLETLPIVK